MRTLHTSARPVSRQGTIDFDPRVPATPRVPLRCVRYYDAKIRFRSTKTLCRAGSGVAHSGGLCTLGGTHHINRKLVYHRYLANIRCFTVHVFCCQLLVWGLVQLLPLAEVLYVCTCMNMYVCVCSCLRVHVFMYVSVCLYMCSICYTHYVRQR